MHLRQWVLGSALVAALATFALPSTAAARDWYGSKRPHVSYYAPGVRHNGPVRRVVINTRRGPEVVFVPVGTRLVPGAGFSRRLYRGRDFRNGRWCPDRRAWIRRGNGRYVYID
ncbi:MAG: hypothetical protein AAGC71_11525 [Pseudomonadota bacterium]